MKPLIVVDMETGGLDAGRCALLGMGAVELVVADGRWKCGLEWEALIAPGAGLEIDAKAREVNGWPSGRWADGEILTETAAARQFDGFLMLCGARHDAGWHMAGFCPRLDHDFLLAWRARTGVEFHLPKHSLMDLQHDARSIMLARLADGCALPARLTSDHVADYLGMPREERPHMPLAGARWAAAGWCRVLNGLRAFPMSA